MPNNIKVLFFLFIFFGSSCSERNDLAELPLEDDDKEVPNDQNPYKTGVDLSTSKTSRWEKKWAKEPFFMLGYGYDVTGRYAHPASIRNRVINIPKFNEDSEGQILFSRANISGAELSLSGTDKECIKTIGERAGFSPQEISIYKNLFQETFKASFESDTAFQNLSYNYFGISEMLTSSLLAVSLPTHKKEWFITHFVTDEFKKDVDIKSAEQIIEVYGTHILMTIKVGQRMDYLYRYAVDKASSGDNWFVYNMHRYFRGVGVLLGSRPSAVSPLKENIYIEVVDGKMPSPNAWTLDLTNYKGSNIQFDGWDKLTNDHLTLIDFWMKDRALTPIYEFVQDEGKKEALKAAYHKYLGGI